jgi:hypothetical protein
LIININLALISGIVSAAIGSYLSAYLFVFLQEKTIFYLFDKNQKKPEILSQLTWKGKIISSFIFADIFKLAAFLPFEARKQRIQMAHKNFNIQETIKYSLRAFTPLLIRDMIFRIITVGTFLNNLNLEHRPQLKYKMSDIRDYIKMKEEMGEKIRYNYFLDYSKISIYSKVQVIFLNLIFSTVIGTVLSHPFDTIATKMLTQTRLKYKGVFQSYKLILKEESIKKLFLSGLSFRISFNLLSGTFVMFSYEKLNEIIFKYYDNY